MLALWGPCGCTNLKWHDFGLKVGCGPQGREKNGGSSVNFEKNGVTFVAVQQLVVSSAHNDYEQYSLFVFEFLDIACIRIVSVFAVCVYPLCICIWSICQGCHGNLIPPRVAIFQAKKLKQKAKKAQFFSNKICICKYFSHFAFICICLYLPAWDIWCICICN